MSTMEFFVPGQPAPQGSKRHVGNGVMVESSKALKPWRQDVVAGARVQMGIDRWETAAAAQVGLTFYFVRPKTVSAVKRPHHTVKPDGDKLARAVFDALTVARVVNDDANIVSYSVHKAYSVPGLPPGVRVTVSTL